MTVEEAAIQQKKVEEFIEMLLSLTPEQRKRIVNILHDTHK